MKIKLQHEMAVEKPPFTEARGEDLQEALRATVPGHPGWVPGCSPGGGCVCPGTAASHHVRAPLFVPPGAPTG